MIKGKLGSEKRVWTVLRTLRTFLCSTLSRPSTTTMRRDCWPEKASRQPTISFSRLTSFLTAWRKPSELITSCLATDRWR